MHGYKHLNMKKILLLVGVLLALSASCSDNREAPLEPGEFLISQPLPLFCLVFGWRLITGGRLPCQMSLLLCCCRFQSGSLLTIRKPRRFLPTTSWVDAANGTVFQQAVMLWWARGHNASEGLPNGVRPDIAARFNGFAAAIQSKPVNHDKLQSQFGKTYWYYYFTNKQQWTWITLSLLRSESHWFCQRSFF